MDTAAYQHDQAETDLREITRMIRSHGWRQFLKLCAEAFEQLSLMENDDFEIIATRIDECIESLADELDGEPVTQREVESENRHNDNREAA